MARVKINSIFPGNPRNTDNHKKQNIYYQYFGEYYDFFLSPTCALAERQHISQLYVENESFTDKIQTVIESKKSLAQPIIGHTGIGKSTILKCFFGLYNEGPTVTDTALVIPIFFDGSFQSETEEPHDFIGKKLSYAVDVLKSKFNLKKYSADSFFQFCEKTRPGYLFGFKKSHFENPTIETLLERAENDYEFGFHKLLVKYYICELSEELIDSIIIILDDIESISNINLRVRFINAATRLYSCLKNVDRKLFVKLLISERPQTQEGLKKKNLDYLDQFNSEIYINTPPPLDELFLKRISYLESRSKTKIKEQDEQPEVSGKMFDRPSFDDAKHALEYLYSILGTSQEGKDSFGEIFLSINNCNVRETLFCIDECVSTTDDFQIERPREGSFSVINQVPKVKISNTLILNVVAFFNWNIYDSEKDISKQRIPNILINAEEPEFDICALLLITALHKRKHSDSSLKITKPLLKSEFISSLRVIAPPKSDTLVRGIEHALKYFTNDDVAVVFSEAILSSSDSLLTLMPKGCVLFDLLSDNSTLLEIYRDDLYLDYANAIQKPLYALSKHKLEAFSEVIKIAKTIAISELDLAEHVYHARSQATYKLLFGEHPISARIYNGLQSSYRRITRKGDFDEEQMPNIDKSLKGLATTINETRDFLKIS